MYSKLGLLQLAQRVASAEPRFLGSGCLLQASSHLDRHRHDRADFCRVLGLSKDKISHSAECKLVNYPRKYPPEPIPISLATIRLLTTELLPAAEPIVL